MSRGAPSTPDHLDREVFRDVIGRFATGVAVITTWHDGQDHGMTASAVTSLSMDPPMLTVCVNRSAPTRPAIADARSFAVNILREDQGELARQFATPAPDKFAGVKVRRGRFGEPLLDEALAHLECEVVNVVEGGTHTVFIAEVRDASGVAGAPLAYFRGRFGRLETEHDETVLADLREMVLSRALPAGTVLELEELREALGAEPPALFHALSRLSEEGLLTRRPGVGYIVTPLDVDTLEAAFRARCVIELGAAQATVGRLTAEQLHQLRRRMEATEPQLHGRPHLDGQAYFLANKAFHEYLAEVAGGPVLVSAYRRLTIEGILLRSFSHAASVGDDTIDDHRRIVEAYEAGDLVGAQDAITTHSENVTRLSREAIEAAGGQV